MRVKPHTSITARVTSTAGATTLTAAAYSGAITKLANAFGGLVYVEMPENATGQPLSVEIRGCVRAPRYVLGKTDAKQWSAEIKRPAAPWLELESEKIILTLPTST